MNWTSKIHKVQSVLDSWSKRDLSLFGKIQIIKTILNISNCSGVRTTHQLEYHYIHLNEAKLVFLYTMNMQQLNMV